MIGKDRSQVTASPTVADIDSIASAASRDKKTIPVFPPLSHHSKFARFQIYLIPIEADQFADTQTSRV